MIGNNLGNTYCDKGDYDNALAEFRELFRMDSAWQNGHSCMARALMSKRDYESAVVELRLAILPKNPLIPDEHRYLGQTLFAGASPASKPMRELRLAVQLGPDSALAHHYLAAALFSVGQDFEGAEAEFRQALRLQPTADNHYYLSACLMNLGRYDAALAELETAARLEPAEGLYRTRKQELLKLMKASSTH